MELIDRESHHDCLECGRRFIANGVLLDDCLALCRECVEKAYRVLHPELDVCTDPAPVILEVNWNEIMDKLAREKAVRETVEMIILRAEESPESFDHLVETFTPKPFLDENKKQIGELISIRRDGTRLFGTIRIDPGAGPLFPRGEIDFRMR